MRINLAPLALAIGVALLAATPAAAETPSHKIARLQHQVATLKAQAAGLKSQLASVTADRDGLKTQVTTLTGQLVDAAAQVMTLKDQVSTLTGQVSTVTGERDSARQQLATAQGGVAGAISTLSQQQIWALFPTIAGRYTTPVWSTTYFQSGGDYASWTFTWCGFCG